MIRDHMQLKDGLCLNRFYCCSNEKIFSSLGTHHSEETRKRISETQKRQKRRIKISIEGTVFDSLTEAAKYYNVCVSTIVYWAKNKKHTPGWNKGRPSPNKGIHWSEETRKKQSEAHKGQSPWNKGIHLSSETRKKIGMAHKRKISIEGNVFDSLTEAAQYHNVGVPTISYWLKTKKHNSFYIEK